MLIEWQVLLCVALLRQVYPAGATETIRIGGMFHPEDEAQKLMFSIAIDELNNNRTMSENTFLAQWDYTPSEDSFRASKQACRLLKSGVLAIFGPQSPEVANHVQSICDTFEIPHIQTRWDPNSRTDGTSLNLYPNHDALSKAYSDLVQLWGWKSFAIIYENSDGLIRLEQLLKMNRKTASEVIVSQIPEGPDYRKMFKKLKKASITNIVIDVSSTKKIAPLLRQAKEVGMMGGAYTYFMATLDLHTVDLGEFRNYRAKIRALRMVNPENPMLSGTLHSLMASFGPEVDPRNFLKTETVLIYDAVMLYAKALQELSASQKLNVKRLTCDSEDSWNQGQSLINVMRMSTIEGLTGSVSFDHRGLRTDFVLDVVELGRQGLRSVSTWSPSTYNTNFKGLVSEDLTLKHYRDTVFTVSAILTTPYVMLKENSEMFEGNEKYEGFCVDLLKELANTLDFKYTINLTADGKYGSLDEETGKWSGMMGDLINGHADLAIGDITITPERSALVDFTYPFMTTGISILYVKISNDVAASMFYSTFVTYYVLALVLVAYVIVSVLIYLFARLHARNLSVEEQEDSQKQYSLLNSFWIAISILMQQGPGNLPKSMAIRIITVFWWLFAILFFCTYTASITVSLIQHNDDVEAESNLNLWEQSTISYGAVEGGSTAAFFKDSSVYELNKMWIAMESNPDVFTESNADGVQKVLDSGGDYAFLMESTSLEYITERNCKLTKIGTNFDSKGYGIALQKNSPYLSAMGAVIQKHVEDGTLQQVKDMWWKEEQEMPCEESNAHMFSDFGIIFQVGSILQLLLFGLLLACCAAAAERFCLSKKIDSH